MTEQEIRLLLRITARTSFLLFSCAFTANALQVLWPWKFTEWLARNRDRFFLGFAASHTVHLAAIIALIITLGHPRIQTLVGGGLVYVFIYALAAAAVPRSAGHKPPTFIGSSKFETFAMYVVWLVFALAFVPRVMRGSPYPVLGVLALATLAIRIAGRTRKAQPAAA